jgi:hypothetical protein
VVHDVEDSLKTKIACALLTFEWCVIIVLAYEVERKTSDTSQFIIKEIF